MTATSATAGRLNAIELAAMDNPLRRISQRLIELTVFTRMLARARVDLRGARLLDVGCGNGFGLSMLARRFEPRRLAGVDLMPEQIERARIRAPASAELTVGDVTRLPFDDASFDAVFVFAILHHVPAWRRGLAEIARVLAPGGVLLVEELRGDFIATMDRTFGTSHPRAAAFDWRDFRGGLADAGLAVVDETTLVPGAMRSFLARRPA